MIPTLFPLSLEGLTAWITTPLSVAQIPVIHGDQLMDNVGIGVRFIFRAYKRAEKRRRLAGRSLRLKVRVATRLGPPSEKVHVFVVLVISCARREPARGVWVRAPGQADEGGVADGGARA